MKDQLVETDDNRQLKLAPAACDPGGAPADKPPC